VTFIILAATMFMVNKDHYMPQWISVIEHWNATGSLLLLLMWIKCVHE